MNNDVKDIGLLRKRKRRRRKLLKLSAFMILIIVGFGLYYNKDRWIPKLEGIGTKYYSISQSKKTKASGNFPLIISNGVNYQVGNMSNNFVILSDAYMHIYSADGDLIETRQHAYSNAVLETVNKKSLIYEHGGNRFRVDNKYKKIYEKELDNNILFARLSKNGYVAVVSSSDTYVCILTVYDDSGNEKYKILSVDRIFDICFTGNSEGCIIISIDAKDGRMVSKASCFTFKEKEARWVTEEFDTFAVKSFYTSEGGVFIVGDTKCAYFDDSGKKISEFAYADELTGYAFNDGKAALIFKNEQKRKTSLVILKGPSADPCEVSFDDELKYVNVDENYVYVMTDKSFCSYNYGGKRIGLTDITDTYDKFYKVNDYFYLLGYDRIDRLDFKG